MKYSPVNLASLPIQKHLVQTIQNAFEPEPDVIAAVLIGSLAKGKGDRVSDADVVVFTQNGFHCCAERCFQAFESDKSIFYVLEGIHNKNAGFKKYIFDDLTSAEIHCIDVNESFKLSLPYHVLFDKTNMISSRLTDKPAPRHEDFPVYTHGDDGLIWELFDCMKWLSRGNHTLAKNYLKKLGEKL